MSYPEPGSTYTLSMSVNTPPELKTQLIDIFRFHNFVIAIVLNSFDLFWSAKNVSPLLISENLCFALL